MFFFQIDGRPLLVHEAQSESIEYEHKKALLGMARCLPYMNPAYSIITQANQYHLSKLFLDEKNGRLVVSTKSAEYCSLEMKQEGPKAIQGIISLIKQLSQIMTTIQSKLPGIYGKMSQVVLDDPQSRPLSFVRKNCEAFDGVFCVEPQLYGFLPKSYKDDVIDRIAHDSEQGQMLQLRGLSPVAYRKTVA